MAKKFIRQPTVSLRSNQETVSGGLGAAVESSPKSGYGTAAPTMTEPAGMAVMVRKKIEEFLAKAGRVYLKPGEEVPEGVAEQIGPKGGRYYIPDATKVKPEKLQREGRLQTIDLSPEDEVKIQKNLSEIEQRIPAKYFVNTVAMSSLLTDHPKFAHLKGVTPRGWPQGYTWDDISGVFDSPEGVFISCNERVAINHGSANALAHEYGHGIYAKVRRDTDLQPRFSAIWHKYQKILSPYESNYIAEFFAESFARWVTKSVGKEAEFYVGRVSEKLLPAELVSFFEEIFR